MIDGIAWGILGTKRMFLACLKYSELDGLIFTFQSMLGSQASPRKKNCLLLLNATSEQLVWKICN